MIESDIVIKAESLGKRYRIGLKEQMHDNFMGSMIDFITSPLRNYRKYRSLYKFDDSESNNSNRTENSPDDIIWALKNISFEVRRGETIGIIGNNGAGKSTLLKILSRITEPTRGNAEIRGRVASLLEVGTGFHPELNGRENVYLNGTILGMKKAEVDKKFDEIVKFSGVGKFVDTPVKRYSSGMLVRLAFSVAAHLEPEILIIDEVLAVGDAAFQNKCLGKMGDVAKGGRTVLFVSHNMAAVESLCSRSIWIENGQIVEIGETKRLIESYLKKALMRSKTPLNQRTDRQGKGDILISKLEIVDQNGNVINHAATGKDLRIRLHYISNRSEPIIDCRFSIAVRRQDTTFFVLSTDLVNRERLDVQGEGFVEFLVPKLPLTESLYYVTVFLEADRVIQDWVHDAVELQVADGDYYGTGRNCPPGTSSGAYPLIGFSWTHKASR